MPVAFRPELLEARELLTVTYHGGELLTSVQAQAVYLGSAWNSNSSLQNQAQSTDQFLSTLASGSYMTMLQNAGYNVGPGSASTGTVDNISVGSVISDRQIQSDLATMISKGQVQAPDSNRLYMVYVEPGVEITLGSANSATSFLGYHGAFADGSNVIHYAVMAYPGSPNPSPTSQGFASTFAEETAVSSHELAEAVTDPNVNFSTLGWYDDQLNGEIGDLAVGHESTITSNGTQYVVQDVVNQNDQIISPNSPQPTPGTLTAPTVTASALSTTVAQLSWNAVNGAQGYSIYQVVNGQNVLLGNVSSSTTAVDVSGLTPGATESFVVAAFNSTTAADSAVVSLTMPSPPAQTNVTSPQVTATAASPTSVNLSWNAEPQATGFNIYWWNGYSVVYLGTVSSSTTSVTVTGLRPGSSSYFLVEAFNNVSYADSQWVFVATPFATIGNNGTFGGHAQQHSQYGNAGGAAAFSVASDEWGGWWQERF